MQLYARNLNAHLLKLINYLQRRMAQPKAFSVQEYGRRRTAPLVVGGRSRRPPSYLP
jgi:hypothetical protein